MLDWVLMVFILLAMSAACGTARRWQGVSKETWDLKRTFRMMALWPAVAVGFMVAGTLGHLEWWVGLAYGTLPGLWSWMPGKYNSHFFHQVIFRERVPYIWAEGVQGGVGGLVASGLILTTAILQRS